MVIIYYQNKHPSVTSLNAIHKTHAKNVKQPIKHLNSTGRTISKLSDRANNSHFIIAQNTNISKMTFLCRMGFKTLN